MMRTPLTEPEVDRLEHYLNAPERIDSTLGLDAVQGLFAAIANSAVPIPMERWLPEVLGEVHRFTTTVEEAEITVLLEHFRDETARQLDEGEGFDFILYGPVGDEEGFAAWAEGYLIGVDLADPPWEEVVEPDDLDNLLFPFLALTGEAKDMAIAAGEEWMEPDEEARLLAEIREGLADHLIEVRRYWFEKSIPDTVRRDAPKVGRNNPCPCGSGKKFKRCCGSASKEGG